MIAIAVLASGRGSNFQALLKAQKKGLLQGEIACLISDKPESGAVEKARKSNIPVELVVRNEFESRAAMDDRIREVLQAHGIDLVVLAGYMRILGPELVDAFRGQIINLHPSLLPAFPGLDALGQALRAGVKVTGATVHLVDEGLDTGPILAQRAFSIPDGASREEIEAILHPLEHELLVEVVAGWGKTKGSRAESTDIGAPVDSLE